MEPPLPIDPLDPWTDLSQAALASATGATGQGGLGLGPSAPLVLGMKSTQRSKDSKDPTG